MECWDFQFPKIQCEVVLHCKRRESMFWEFFCSRKISLDFLVLQWPVLLAACGGHEAYALPTFCIYHKYTYLIVLSRKQTTTHHHSHSLYYICFKTKKSDAKLHRASMRPLFPLQFCSGKLPIPGLKSLGSLSCSGFGFTVQAVLRQGHLQPLFAPLGMFIKFHVKC